MLEDFDVWKLLAGLGIFIFGMFLMEESVKKLAGRSFKILIREYTTGKIRSLLSGTFVTAILQSSSAVSLMLLAFVGAGIMSMKNAIGVILGSNLGTTITSWIVATFGFQVEIESFALPLIGIGGLGIIFLGKSEKYSNVSKLLVGFGFLFTGLDYMKQSVEALTTNFDISSIPDYGILIYLFLGIVMTAVMQSSSATMAVILTALDAAILEFDSAAAMVIGANVGTTVTILLGSLGAAPIKKRVAYSHFAFNLITAILALIVMPVLVYLVLDVFSLQDNMVIGLALFHTFFNLLGVLIFLPFIGLFAKLLVKVFPDVSRDVTMFINQTTAEVPEAAVAALKNETLHLLKEVFIYNLRVLNIDESLVLQDTSTAKPKKSSLELQYENLKLLQAAIFSFATNVQTRELSKTDASLLHHYLHGARMALHSAKTLKDIRHNFEEFESADNEFLNQQYGQFRKRLTATYFKLDEVINESQETHQTKTLLKLLKQLRKDDERLVKLAADAITGNQIQQLDVSTLLIVNRAFVQSSRQVIQAIKEILLSEPEQEKFELVEEVRDSLEED
jgi:phosphate:Na+ symporter